MTHTESLMRHMRIVLGLFRVTADFDEQWLHCRSFLDTLHSIADTDPQARRLLSEHEVVRYGLVLRNIFHHQPLTVFGRHVAMPSSMTLAFKAGEPPRVRFGFALVIGNGTIASPEVHAQLRKSSHPALAELLEKLQGNDLPVERLMAGIMEVVEDHCRQTGQYEERADSATGGYRLGGGRARPSSGR